jgi:hypothetical protein
LLALVSYFFKILYEEEKMYLEDVGSKKLATTIILPLLIIAV